MAMFRNGNLKIRGHIWGFTKALYLTNLSKFQISDFSTLWSLTIMVMVDYIMKMVVSHDVYSELSHCRYGLLTVQQIYTVYRP